MKNIYDIMVCPECDSDNTYQYDDDEIEFSDDNTGHYRFFCKCQDCGTRFVKNMYFKYEVKEVV